MTFKYFFCFVAMLCCGYIAAAPYSSAHVEEPDTTLQLNEISITAIKQGNDIYATASAASALNRRALERINVSAVKDISQIVPNFHIPDYGSRMTSSIYVRGIGARIDQPVVGMNIDNVPIINKDNYDFNLLDIYRVEMLRGPQSTLFGRNTMGGLINIYTLSPQFYQGSRFLVEYGTANSWKAAISHYAMLRDNLGIGISAGYNGTDGFFTNKFNGEKCDWEHNFSGRAKVFYRHSNKVSLENTLSFSVSRQGGYPYASVETGEINYNDTCFYRRNSISDGLTVKHTTENYTLSSVTSYQHLDDNMTLDQDFLPLPYFTLTQKRKEHALTQDIVVTDASRNAYHWLAGAFAFYRHTSMQAPVTFLDEGISSLIEQHRNNANPDYPIRWDSREFPLNSNFKQNNYGFALYHQSSYTLGDWKFAAALRLDYEKAALRHNSNCNSSYTTFNNTSEPYFQNIYMVTPVVIDDSGNLDKSFLQLLPKVSITYNLPSLPGSNIYAAVSKGYKSGGFNTQMFSDVLQQKVMGFMGIGASYDVDDIVGYKPEHSWNYELGTHLEWSEPRLSADISAFYINVSNQQLTVFPEGTTTGRIMTNAGKSRSFGGELSISYKPITRLELTGAYGYTNAKFVHFDNGKVDYSGKFIPYAPRNTIHIAALYTLDTRRDWCRLITFNTRLQGVGKIYWNEENSLHQPLYFLLSASVTFANSNYSFQLWGENLTNTRFDTFYFMSMGNAFTQQGKKLRVGATLRLNI